MSNTRDENLRMLVDCIFTAHEEVPLDCETCAEQYTCLVERVAAGTQLSELWPELEAHLECCPDCREEYDALVAIVSAELNGELNALD